MPFVLFNKYLEHLICAYSTSKTWKPVNLLMQSDPIVIFLQSMKVPVFL